MIIFRCLNGAVAWQTSIIHERPRVLRSVCMNDKFAVTIPAGPPAARITAIESMASHSITLKGAIQQLTEITFAPDF